MWAAWGTIIESATTCQPGVRDLIALGQARNARWFSAGKRSRKGHPHHPLYLRKDSPLDPFDVDQYLTDVFY